MNGEKETGVTTFKLKHEIDTGDILLQEKIAIGDAETAGELHDRMKDIGAQLLVKTIDALEKGQLQAQPQIHGSAEKHAPKLFKEDGEIDWQQPAALLFNRIRGLSPYPAAFTRLQGKTLKIFNAEVIKGNELAAPGTYLSDHKTYLKFAAADAFLSLLEVQLEGKKRMGIEEFLRGVRL